MKCFSTSRSSALDSSQAVALDGTEHAQYPFWSPDSRWIAFFDRTEGLKKIPVNGGPGQTICPAGNGKGGTWNEDETIIFTPSFDAPLMKVAAVGGEPVPLTNLEDDEGFGSHRHPFFLPDGRRFLYLARANSGGDSEIRLASLDERGYFDIGRSGLGVIDRVVTSFTEEDVEALGDNIVLILQTVREMTQPEVMQMLQRTFTTVQNEELVEPTEPPGTLALLREMRQPEVRRGLSKALHMLRSLGEESPVAGGAAQRPTDKTEN